MKAIAIRKKSFLRSIGVFLFFTIFTIWETQAQCTEEVSITTLASGSNHYPFESLMTQSFTATRDGRISSISLNLRGRSDFTPALRNLFLSITRQGIPFYQVVEQHEHPLVNAQIQEIKFDIPIADAPFVKAGEVYEFTIGDTDRNNFISVALTDISYPDGAFYNEPIHDARFAVRMYEDGFAQDPTISSSDLSTSPVTLTADNLDPGVVGYQWFKNGDEIDGAISATFDVQAGEDGMYLVEVLDADGCGNFSSDFTVDLKNPVFTSVTSINYLENDITEIITFSATDLSEPINYSLGTNNDEAFFNLNPGSGALTFLSSPDFENGMGSGTTSNHYVIEVIATDAVLNTTSQIVTINVLNEDEGVPIITSANAFNFPENSPLPVFTITATDETALTFSLDPNVATNDNEFFQVNGTSGVVSFILPPDFETPEDENNDNDYSIELIVTDAADNSSTQTVTITVTDQEEILPVFTSASSVTIPENTTMAYTAVATDDSNPLSYSLGTQKDESLFTIDGSTGEVTFRNIPNYEAPTDQFETAFNNEYIIDVMATDAALNSAMMGVTIIVSDDTDELCGQYALELTENSTVVSSPVSFADRTKVSVEYYFRGSNIQSAVRIQEGNDFLVAGRSSSSPHHLFSWQGPSIPIGTAVTDGEWHHVAVTWEKGVQDNGYRSYLDGVLIRSESASNNDMPDFSAVDLYLGSLNNQSEFSDGVLDEVRIWNRVITHEEISTRTRDNFIYDEDPALLVYFDFDEISNGFVYDIAYAGSDGITQVGDYIKSGDEKADAVVSLTSEVVLDIVSPSFDGIDLDGMFYVPGSLIPLDTLQSLDGCDSLQLVQRVISPRPSNDNCGTILNFDGTNDHIPLTNSLTLSGDYTIEGWFKGGGDAQHIMSNASNTFFFEIQNGEKLRFLSNNQNLFSVASGLASDGNWHHFAGVRNTIDETLTIYIDGEASGSVDYPDSQTDFGDITIGRQESSNGRYLNGSLDEIRIWSDIRTLQELTDNFGVQLQGDEENLVAYYNFDEAGGTVLTDLISGNNGTLMNMEEDDWTRVDGSALASQTISFDPLSRTYGDVDFDLSASSDAGTEAEGFAITYESSDPTVATVSGKTVTIVGAGTTTITASQEGGFINGSCYGFASVTQSLTVEQAPLTVTADDLTITYGDDPASSLSVTYSGFVNGENENTADFSGTISFAEITETQANATPYTDVIVPAGLTSVNYALSFENGDLTINTRQLEVIADSQSKVYGEEDPELTYEITFGSLVSGDMLSGALTRVVGEDVGHYSINQGTLDNSNYQIEYSGEFFEITQRPLTITADAQSKTYGDTDPPLTYQITSGSLAFNEEVDGGLIRNSGEDVGTYGINAEEELLSGNYDLTYVGADLTITQRSITITADAQSKTYGDADPTLTYQIARGTLAFTDTFTGSLARVTGEEVGSYAISQGDVTLNANYNLSYEDNDLTITARPITFTADPQSKTYGEPDPTLTYKVTSGTLAFTDIFSGSLAREVGEGVGAYAINQGDVSLGSNYDLSFTGSDLVIGTRPITISADAKSKTYGDIDPELTYQITSGTLAFADTFSGGLSREAGENVGTYTINQGDVSLSSNYDLSFVGSDLVIGTRPLTVMADALSKIYGEDDPVLTFQLTSGSLIGGDDFAGNLVREAGEGVGSYAINQGTLSNSNYDITYGGASLTVTKRPITITADAQSKTYGDVDPALTYQITNGILAFTDNFSGTLARVVGENVGTYAIDQGDVSLNANYELSYVAANLTISKASITAEADDQSITFGDALPTLSISYSGFVNGDDISVIDEIPTAGTSAVGLGGSDANTYPITLTGGSDNNYELTLADGTLTINKAEQTIDFDAISDVDLVSTDMVTLSAASSASIPVSFELLEGEGTLVDNVLTIASPGNFSIEASQLGNANYNPASSVTRSFVVTDSRRDDQTITFGSLEPKTYGDASFDLSATASSGLSISYASSDETVATISGSSVTIVGAGTATITATQGGNADFNPAVAVAQVLTVAKASLTATANDQMITFGDALPSLTLNYTGFVNGDAEGVIDTEPTIATTAEGNGASDAGVYPITLSGGGDNNYALNLIDGTLTISKADQVISFDAIADVDLASTNEVTLAATSNAGLGVAFALMEGSGTIANDILTVTSTGNFVVEASQAGNVNYNAASEVQSFTVTDSRKADQTIDFPEISDKTYGDVFTLDATASSNLAVSYVLVSGPATLMDAEVTVSGVGEVVIEASQNGDTNFNPATTESRSFTAGKAALTVTADDKERTYNMENPALTISYGGFIGGDVEADLDELPAASTAADVASDAGSYAIVVDGGLDNNYDFQYTNGTLIVTKAAASIMLSDLEQESDGTAKEPTVTTDPVGLNFTIEWDAGAAPVTAGDYDFTVTIEETNYEGEESGVLSVIQVLGLLDTSVRIYPNPVSNFLVIDSDEPLEVEITTLEGKVVLQTKSDKEIDLSALSDAVHLLKLTNDRGESKTTTFIKRSN